MNTHCPHCTPNGHFNFLTFIQETEICPRHAAEKAESARRLDAEQAELNKYWGIA